MGIHTHAGISKSNCAKPPHDTFPDNANIINDRYSTKTESVERLPKSYLEKHYVKNVATTLFWHNHLLKLVNSKVQTYDNIIGFLSLCE